MLEAENINHYFTIYAQKSWKIVKFCSWRECSKYLLPCNQNLCCTYVKCQYTQKNTAKLFILKSWAVTCSVIFYLHQQPATSRWVGWREKYKTVWVWMPFVTCRLTFFHPSILRHITRKLEQKSPQKKKSTTGKLRNFRCTSVALQSSCKQWIRANILVVRADNRG